VRRTVCQDGEGSSPFLFMADVQSMDQLEQELLNGQKLQGAATAEEVNRFLRARGKVNEFPLFTAVYEIVYKRRDPATVVNAGDGRKED